MNNQTAWYLFIRCAIAGNKKEKVSNAGKEAGEGYSVFHISESSVF
jgi:hypothetical protein